jgi:anti-sigma regulatory factor (Ser/Thr protein kinase)
MMRLADRMADAQRTLLVVGSPEGVRQAAVEFDAFAATNRLPADAAWPLHLALDEILSNIVRHAYAEGGQGREIEVGFRLKDGVVELTLLDDGLAFDPLTAPQPDTTGPAEDRPVGGLGIFLLRKLMDHVEYERQAGRNRLVCRKRVDIVKE